MGCLQLPHLVPTFRLIFGTRHIHHVPWSTPLRTHTGCKFLEGLPLVLLITDLTVDEIVVVLLYIKYTPQSIPRPNILFVEYEALM